MKSCFLIKGFTLKSYKVLLMQGRIKHFVTSHLGLFSIYQLKNLLVTAIVHVHVVIFLDVRVYKKCLFNRESCSRILDCYT